jgi:integrase
VQEIGATAPAMANQTRKVLHFVFEHAKIRPNPFHGIASYKGGSHHTWTEDELAKYEARWPLGTRQRLAYALLLYTDQRESDVAGMRRSDIADGAVRVIQEKTGKELWIPIHPELTAALKAVPVKGVHLIGNARTGQPITGGQLYKLVKGAVAKAGLPAECVPHGLRKALLRRLAESGGTAKELQSISGHATLKEVERYTEAADQKKLSVAAMNKLKRGTGSV